MNYMSVVATNDLSAVGRYHETSYITMRLKSSRLPDDSSPARVLSRNILLLGMKAYIPSFLKKNKRRKMYSISPHDACKIVDFGNEFGYVSVL